MKTATRLISSAVLLTSAFFVSSTLACNTTAWQGGVTDATAGDPTADGIARVSGLCGMKVTATNGHVADNSPTDETTFIGRFYFFPKNVAAGSHEIFVALSDQTNSESDVFVISYDSGNITLNASGAGGNSATVAADATHWNLVEFAWTSGGTGELWARCLMIMNHIVHWQLVRCLQATQKAMEQLMFLTSSLCAMKYWRTDWLAGNQIAPLMVKSISSTSFVHET